MTRLGAVTVCLLLAACSNPDPLPVYSTVPDFSLTDHDGAAFSSAELQGRVWAADFIFTSCAGPCPLLTQRMADLQEALREVDPDGGVKLISFSVDPETDTPEVLAEYAERFGVDLSRWSFLTGGKQEIYELILKGFRLAVDDGAISENGKPGPGIITHSVRFALIDKQGRIRGYYPGNEAGVVEQMLPDIQRLLDDEDL